MVAVPDTHKTAWTRPVSVARPVCAGCPFLGMAFDRDLRAAYPHRYHVCWAVAERPSLLGSIRRWLAWRPWRSTDLDIKPWQPVRFTSLAAYDQQRCLGSEYTACHRYPRPQSLMRRLTHGGMAETRGQAPLPLAAIEVRASAPRLGDGFNEAPRRGGDVVPSAAGDL